jgi:hypothetical protein
VIAYIALRETTKMKKNLFVGFLALYSTILFTGCASIIEGNTQNVNIYGEPNINANCQAKDSNGKNYNITIPGNLIVNRGDGPLNVSCQGGEGSGSKIVQETLEPWFFASILFTGIFAVVDTVNGSYQKYPDVINIPMSSATGQTVTH